VDLDASPENGLTYDSHELGQDIVQEFANEWNVFEWTWQVPADAPAGRYYAQAVFRDMHDVVVWNTSAWYPLFEVP